jgi:peptidoglycan/LPS O-acetylase OafA/YrhL
MAGILPGRGAGSSSLPRLAPALCYRRATAMTSTVGPEPTRPVHHPGLDGLRGIAVLLVLYCHAPQLFGRNDGSDGWPWAASRGAWLGVDLFFVLSGFLITGLLLQDRSRPGALGRFWLRRALRIFPLALLYLAVLAAALAWVPGLARLREPGAFWWALTYTTNVRVLLEGWRSPPFDILWSLAVEEHFYLVWPFVVLFVRRRSVALATAALVLSAPLLRWLLLPGHGALGVYVATWCRTDALAAGALLALAWHGPWRDAVLRAGRWCLLPATVWLGWVLAVPVPAWFHIGGLSAIAGAFVAWVAVALAPPRWLAPVLTHGALRAVGRISYGLYVWHLLVGEAVRRLVPGGLALRSLVWLAAVFVVAQLSYRTFEAPLLRLRERFERPSAR